MHNLLFIIVIKIIVFINRSFSQVSNFDSSRVHFIATLVFAIAVGLSAYLQTIKDPR